MIFVFEIKIINAQRTVLLFAVGDGLLYKEFVNGLCYGDMNEHNTKRDQSDQSRNRPKYDSFPRK